MKILLIRFSSLGDVILTTSVARNIKKNNPSATVNILTKKEYKPVFLNNPDIDNIVTGISWDIKYDFIIDLHSSTRSNFVKYFIPAEKRLVYDNASYARRLYLHTRHSSEELKKSVIHRYLEPLEKIGFNVCYVPPEVKLNAQELKKVKNIVPSKEYIAIAAGAKWRTKQWIVENYIELTVKIIKELNMDVVLVGSEDDIELTNEIFKGTGTLRSHVINLAGKTSLRELAAVIKNSIVLVSTDSGPMHLGWAIATPVVALFGPTVKEFGFQPQDKRVSIIEKDIKCRPCSVHGSKKCKHKDMACMQRIEVPDVLNEIKKFL